MSTTLKPIDTLEKKIKIECLKCDSCVENKQKGLMCFNPNSDYFNERLKDIEIDECKYFTDICYVNPKDGDEKGLFDD